MAGRQGRGRSEEERGRQKTHGAGGRGRNRARACAGRGGGARCRTAANSSGARSPGSSAVCPPARAAAGPWFPARRTLRPCRPRAKRARAAQRARHTTNTCHCRTTHLPPPAPPPPRGYHAPTTNRPAPKTQAQARQPHVALTVGRNQCAPPDGPNSCSTEREVTSRNVAPRSLEASTSRLCIFTRKRLTYCWGGACG